MSERTSDSARPTRPGSRILVVAHCIYRALLLAYPAAFRAEFGEEMSQVFHDTSHAALREGGAATMLCFWSIALTDLAATAVAERLKEGFRMSRFGFVRLGGIALLVAAAVQTALLAAQAAVTLDFGVSFADPSGHSVVESPWIGRLEVATTSLGALLPLVLLLGMLSLHAFAKDRMGVFGWVTITLAAVGLIAFAAASALASALSWADLSQCVNPRDCNIYDGTGWLRAAYAILAFNTVLASVGLLLYGIAMLRVRPLPRGNVLPLLLTLAWLLPFLVTLIASILVPATDSEGTLKLEAVSALFAVAGIVTTFLLGRALLRAAPLTDGGADAAGGATSVAHA
jgi:hypothetical protein